MGSKSPQLKSSWGLLLAELQLMLLLEHFGISRVYMATPITPDQPQGREFARCSFQLLFGRDADRVREAPRWRRFERLVLSCGGSGTFRITYAHSIPKNSRSAKKRSALLLLPTTNPMMIKPNSVLNNVLMSSESSDLVGLVSLPEAPENGH
jgi:hypothetical protein